MLLEKREKLIQELLRKYAFSTGNAFIVLAKDIPELINDYVLGIEKELSNEPV